MASTYDLLKQMVEKKREEGDPLALSLEKAEREMPIQPGGMGGITRTKALSNLLPYLRRLANPKITLTPEFEAGKMRDLIKAVISTPQQEMDRLKDVVWGIQKGSGYIPKASGGPLVDISRYSDKAGSSFIHEGRAHNLQDLYHPKLLEDYRELKAPIETSARWVEEQLSKKLKIPFYVFRDYPPSQLEEIRPYYNPEVLSEIGRIGDKMKTNDAIPIFLRYLDELANKLGK